MASDGRKTTTQATITGNQLLPKGLRKNGIPHVRWWHVGSWWYVSITPCWENICILFVWRTNKSFLSFFSPFYRKKSKQKKKTCEWFVHQTAASLSYFSEVKIVRSTQQAVQHHDHWHCQKHYQTKGRERGSVLIFCGSYFRLDHSPRVLGGRRERGTKRRR